MGRIKRTRMIVRDVKVEGGKCIIAIDIRRGPHTWRKAYGFSANQLREGEFTAFNEALKARVREDALQLEEDKTFEERVLLRIEDLIDTTVVLD